MKSQIAFSFMKHLKVEIRGLLYVSISLAYILLTVGFLQNSYLIAVNLYLISCIIRLIFTFNLNKNEENGKKTSNLLYSQSSSLSICRGIDSDSTLYCTR